MSAIRCWRNFCYLDRKLCSKAADSPGLSQSGCLWSWVERSQFVQRQQNAPEWAYLVAFGLGSKEASLFKGSRMLRNGLIWLPLVLGRKKPVCSKAADSPRLSLFGCLWSWVERCQFVQRQQNAPEWAYLVAFEHSELHWVEGRGN